MSPDVMREFVPVCVGPKFCMQKSVNWPRLFVHRMALKKKKTGVRGGTESSERNTTTENVSMVF